MKGDGGLRINHDKFNIVILGTGGTGSDVAIRCARLAYSVIDTNFKEVRLTFVDNDVVEESNLYRQQFAPADLGENKAELLATRYGIGLGIDIHYKPERVKTPSQLEELLFKHKGFFPILVGCVDNNSARRIMNSVFTKAKDLIWVDSGNEAVSGQVVFSLKIGGRVLLPPVTEIFPNIMDESLDPVTKESCSRLKVSKTPADLTKSGQFFVTNATAANIVMNFLFVILFGMDLVVHAVDFNVLKMISKPRYISDLFPTNAEQIKTG